MNTWKSAFDARKDLERYGDTRIGLFALAIRFGLDDLDTVASESITDGSDDKKADLVYIDNDEGIAVVAQCFLSQKTRAEAPSNKASDLNTAVSWLLHRRLDELPDRLKSSAEEIRQGIIDGTIEKLHVWYVHNLSESTNVRNELLTVEATLKSAIKSAFPGKDLLTQVVEIGSDKLDEWYAETQSPILVTEQFRIPISHGFSLEAPKWKAFVTSIPARFLYKSYKTHKTRLFSANVRDYLGSRKSDANINYGIKRTAERSPQDFWVFNNGLTMLVNSFKEEKKATRRYLIVDGLSVVNGAQTTGAIGSLNKQPSKNALVPVRFVVTNDSETILDIVEFNNSQNKISASDFRSRDKIQKRLRSEFQKIPDAEYFGGRRGGHADAIKRNPKLLPSYTVGQALAALHQDPIVASNEKSNIWASDHHYSKYFNDETTAAGIVFAYGLLKAVESKKLELVTKSKSDGNLTELEDRHLQFFRNRGATYLLSAAIASSLETILSRKIPNIRRLSFGLQCSPVKAEKRWRPIVDIATSFSDELSEAFTHGLKNVDLIRKRLNTFQSLIQATATANKEALKSFSKTVKQNPK